MGKPSSSISAKMAYERALVAGYQPALIDPTVKMHSFSWDAIRSHANVEHSKSGDSIVLIDTEGKRPSLTLITKGMLSNSAVARFEQAGISF